MNERGRRQIGVKGIELCKREKADYHNTKVLFNYVSNLPSLEHIALVYIATKLYGNPDIKCCSSMRNADEYFEKLEEIVHEKLAKIFLPDFLKMKISNFFRPVGLQLKRCLYYEYEGYCGLSCIYQVEDARYWAMDGTIDKVRSLKEFIGKPLSLNREKTFSRSLWELACKYCLVEYIRDLWLIVSDEEFAFEYTIHDTGYHNHIFVYWIAVLENWLPSLLRHLLRHDPLNIYDSNCSINENMVNLSICIGNEIGFKHFWFNLTEHEKTTNIEKWVVLSIKRINNTVLHFCIKQFYYQYQEYEAGTEIMCFLVSQLESQGKQEEIFQTHSEKILISLFHHWPLQRFFLPTITAMFDYLQEEVFVRIMSVISEEIGKKRTTELVLREVWKGSPLKLKKAFIHFLPGNASLIVRLIEIKDIFTITAILKYASAVEKKDIVFRVIKEVLFFDLLSLGDSAILMIDTFISEVLSSDTDQLWFKQSVVMVHASRLCNIWLSESKIQTVEKFLNWALQSEDMILEFKKTHIDPSPLYNVLIHSSDSKPAYDFLRWYFETDEEIANLQKNFVHKFPCFRCSRMVSSFFRQGVEGWNQLEKFLSHGFLPLEDMTEFKKQVLSTVKFFVSCMEDGGLECVTLCLNWWSNCPEVVKEFKEELLLQSDYGIIRHVRENHYPDWARVRRWLKLFSPISNEDITTLMSQLSDNSSIDIMNNDKEIVQERNQNFFDLLSNLNKDPEL